jgi:hypothetical protein
MKHRIALVVTVLALLVNAASASAADSHAPRGARADWLPSSEWVMSSWLPYDEARLEGRLHVTRAQLAGWLDDRRTLGELARRHGIRDQPGFAAWLVEPRTRHAPPRLARTLRARALDTLTQAHLANHVLFHVFHTPAIANDARRIFGITPARFRSLRDRGLSPQRIGATSRRTEEEVRAGLARLLMERGRRSVALGAMSRGQAGALWAEQSAGLDAYLRRAFRTPQGQLTFLCHPEKH